MSEQPPKKDAKAVTVPCQMLGVSEFDVSTLIPSGKKAGRLVSCDTILETSEFDCSQAVTSDASAPGDRTFRPTDGVDVQQSIRNLIEEIRRPLDALLAASSRGREQELAPSALERQSVFLQQARDAVRRASALLPTRLDANPGQADTGSTP